MKMKIGVLVFTLAWLVAESFIFIGQGVRASENLQLNLTKKQPIDVVLTVGETDDDLGNFERDIKNKLYARGVDTSLVNIEAVETQTMSSDAADAEKIFNSWDSFPNNGSVYWRYDSNNKWITTDYNEPYETGFINKDQGMVKDFEMSTSVNVTQPGQPLGLVFGMHKNESDSSRWNMYYLWMSYDHEANETVVTLFKAENQTLNRTVQRSIDRRTYSATPLRPYNGRYFGWPNHAPYNYGGFPHGTLQQRGAKVTNVNDSKLKTEIVDYAKIHGNFKDEWVDLKLDVNKGKIKAYVNGNMEINLEDKNNPYEEGYFGIFAYSHVQPKFKEVSSKIKTYKDFSEVIRQPEWREGSDRYIVNVSDVEMNDFNDESKTSEMLTRTLNEGTHFMSIGTGENKDQMEDFIRKNDGNGEFFSGSYNSYMSDLADYIEDRIPDESGEGELYVLKDEPIDIDVTPSSLRNNTQTSEYPQGRWRIEHDYDYYDNNEGQAQWANQWQEDLKLTFDKPGKYELFFEEETIEPRYVYVHRKPVVQFDVDRAGNNIDVTDTSYDLDHQSDGDKGIEEVEWKWQKVEEGVWKQGKPDKNLEFNKDYIVQLRVKDKEGVWSDRESKYITTKPVESTPVSSFSLDSNSVSKYDRLTIEDTSYDPAGKNIILRDWKVERSDGVIVHDSSSEPSDISDWSAGEYAVSLRVKNTDNNWSETYSKLLTVTSDNEEPEVLVSPASRSWGSDEVSVDISYTDPGGSGFKHQRYALTDSSSKPGSGYTSWNSSDKTSVNIDNHGEFYIHMQARDEAGNVMERTTGPYRVDKEKPSKPTIEMSSNDWEENVSYSISDNGDNGSGVNKIQYRLRGDKDWRDYEYIEKDIPDNLKGEVDIKARVIDNVGNISNVSHEIAKIDDKIPHIKDFNVNVSDNKVRIDVDAEDLESGVGGYKYYMDEDGSGFEPMSEWVKEDNWVMNLEDSKRYRFKVVVKDKNSNIVESSKYKDFYFVTTPSVSYVGTKDGDFKNTATIEWSPSVDKGENEVYTEIFREGKLWRTFDSGDYFKDENLDYERDYEYGIRNVYENGGDIYYSEWINREVKIGTPELEFDTNKDTYYRTPFSEEVNIEGILRFRQGADVSISVLDESKEFSVTPYETINWVIPVKVSENKGDVKVKVETLDDSLDQGVEKDIDVKVKELHKTDGVGDRLR